MALNDLSDLATMALTKPMTNKEIYNSALEEWTGILMQLRTAICKPVESDRLKVYCDLLQRVPLGLLELAINRVLQENTWSNVPAIGVIWEAIRRELGNPYDLNVALTEWQPMPRSRINQPELFQ